MKIPAYVRIALIYLLFGVLWIFFSDTLLFAIISDQQTILELQLFKGWVFILLTSATIYFLVKNYSNKRDQLEYDLRQTEKQIKETNKKLIALTENLYLVREEERLNISMEIHDELGQQMSALKMGISAFGNMINKNSDKMEEKTYYEYKAELADMLKLSDESIKTIRKISSHLRTEVLEKLGLFDAVRSQSEDFEKKFGITVKLEMDFEDETRRYEKKKEIVVFRVLQESLTNIARHAKATEVKIFLIEENNKLNLVVSDNGVGFFMNESKEFNSLGIMGIKERARLVNAQLEIISGEGKGTIVTLSVPLH